MAAIHSPAPSVCPAGDEGPPQLPNDIEIDACTIARLPRRVKLINGPTEGGKAVEVARIALKGGVIFLQVLGVSYRWRHLLNQLPFSVARSRKVAPLPHAQFASYLEASRARLPLSARERRDQWSRWLRAIVFLATLGGGSWVLWESGQALARF